MKREMTLIMTVLCLGCARMAGSATSSMIEENLESAIDTALETQEEERVRHDTERYHKGRPLKYHRDVDHLRAHRQELWLEEMEDDRARKDRREKEAQQRKMEEDRQLYETYKEISDEKLLPAIVP